MGMDEFLVANELKDRPVDRVGGIRQRRAAHDGAGRRFHRVDRKREIGLVVDIHRVCIGARRAARGEDVP